MGKVNKFKRNFTATSTKVTNIGKISKAKQKLYKEKINLPFISAPTENRLLENANLKKKITSTDSTNITSFKSKKSGKKTIKKKEKLNLKRNLLMKKIDTIKQIKKEEKVRAKRKTTSVIGDTNPLRDALPSLESLIKKKSEINYKLPQGNKKKRGIEKTKQRTKKINSDMDLFKRAINDKSFRKNPFEIITSHIQAIVEQERSKVC